MSRLGRREFLGAMGLGLSGLSASGWFPLLAQELAQNKKRKRHCVLLWMTGGPSQTDTFDMKPGHANGGEFKEIATSASGLRWSEHLPNLAKLAEHVAVVRSLNTKEGDHGRGTYLMRTGQQPRGPVRYPTIGSSISKELGEHSESAVNFVSIAPYRAFNQAAFSPGFLGPKYAPLTVGATDNIQPGANEEGGYAQLRVDDLAPPSRIASDQFSSRVRLWRTLQDQFLATHRGPAPLAHDTVYRRALTLMDSDISTAFDLSQEPAEIRDAYGKGRFGQGCLMARRLIERGVPFIEVSLGFSDNGGAGWDTHQNNFPAVRSLCEQLDTGWSMLMRDLQDRGLLESTTILWLGEFGRTPRINEQAGRDHFPAAWSCVFAGGGIKGGQAFGETSPDGTEVVTDKVNEADVLATLCAAVGVDPAIENISDLGRPLKISEGQPIRKILA